MLKKIISVLLISILSLSIGIDYPVPHKMGINSNPISYEQKI